MAAYDYGGFSLKVLIDRATQRLALAEDFDRKGDLQGAYGEYKKWAE